MGYTNNIALWRTSSCSIHAMLCDSIFFFFGPNSKRKNKNKTPIGNYVHCTSMPICCDKNNGRFNYSLKKRSAAFFHAKDFPMFDVVLWTQNTRVDF